jgi:hypothetical protein
VEIRNLKMTLDPAKIPATPLELSKRGSPNDLGEQFMLERNQEVSEGWRKENVGRWTLGSHP